MAFVSYIYRQRGDIMIRRRLSKLVLRRKLMLSPLESHHDTRQGDPSY